MPIHRHEDWIQIAELDQQDRIRFTAEFQAIMCDLGWEAKAFVGHLLAIWYDPFEHLLDYSSGKRSSRSTNPASLIATVSTNHRMLWSTGPNRGARTTMTTTRHISPEQAWGWGSIGIATCCGRSWFLCACRDGSCWSTRKESCRKTTSEDQVGRDPLPPRSGLDDQSRQPGRGLRALQDRSDGRARQWGEDPQPPRAQAFSEAVKYAQANLCSRAAELIGDRDPRRTSSRSSREPLTPARPAARSAWPLFWRCARP